MAFVYEQEDRFVTIIIYFFVHYTGLMLLRFYTGSIFCDLKEHAKDTRVLPHTLRHVQRSQHLLKDGTLHVGAPQVRLLKVAS